MSHSRTATSRPLPIWNASSQTVAGSSTAISSVSGQTSTGGPSQPPRGNQPEIVSRLRKGHGAENMAIVRHFALNLVRCADDKRSLKRRRKCAGWHPPTSKASSAYLPVNLNSLPCGGEPYHP